MQQKIPALAAFILALSMLVQPALAQERRPARIGGKPNLNGIWQAANGAYWNLEGHSAESVKEFASTMGAIAAIPAGNSVVVGGTIPDADAEELKRLGVAEVFTPGAPTTAIVDFLRSALAPA